MTRDSNPLFPQRRPTGQQESPGPTGIHDSASPDESAALASRLNAGWDELEASRDNIVQLLVVGHLKGEDPMEEIEKAWDAHQTLTIAYYALLNEYIRDHYDPEGNWGLYLRIGALLGDDVLQQQLGLEGGEAAERLTLRLSVLLCRKALEHYRETGDEESLYYTIALAGEVQAHGANLEEVGEELADLIHEVYLQSQRLGPRRLDAELDHARKEWLRTVILGYRSGDPMWFREMVKGVNRAARADAADPIKSDFLRSRLRDGAP